MRKVFMENASVLVIDDNKIMRDILRGILEPEGYSVNSCENGPSALKLAEEKHFEIVLSDFQMPDMNGDEVVKLMRLQHPDSFIIGFSLANKKQVFLEAGANHFINKEQLVPDLISVIESRNY
jgi:CheY-like chemotaxis protein